MVVKKYLRAAPRSELWEAKAEALLKSLGGDKVKREHVARQTLDMLKERHKHEKKRTGPGRKSNAEHAISFYEYLIGDKGTGDKEDNEHGTMSSADDGKNSNSDQSSSSSSSSTIDTKEFLDQHNDTCDVCNLGGEVICCSTCTLVFHKECIRPFLKSIPSDWSCPHCITQGIKNYKRHSKTWKSAASGLRQMRRIKSELDEGKGEADYTGKKNVEESRAANTTKSTKVKSLTNDDLFSLNEETSDASSVSSSGAVSDSKRNLALYKIADSYSNSTENLLVRGRRQRKQPSLYQPQLCADSRWRSDGKNSESDGNDNDDDIDIASNISDAETDRDSDSSKGEKYESKAGHSNSRRVIKMNNAEDLINQTEDSVIICIGEDAVGRKKIGSPFCNFCRDNASILICVFCGCRTCFGKHDKTTLLLCDSCDDEYHTRCLGLATVPSAQTWYCSTCTKTKSTTTRKILSTRRASSAITQPSDVDAGSEKDNSKRSSPNKKSRSSSTTTTRILPLAAARATNAKVPEKRGRGRPPKFRVEKESMPASSLSPRKRVRTPKAVANSVEIIEQRKRGRPSKSTTNAAATASLTGRKRGRPPKNISTIAPTTLSKSTSSPAPRKRGRPPKANPDPIAIPRKVDSAVKKKVPKPITPSSSATLKKVSNSAVSEVLAKSQEPLKVSRVSGRKVKRASFHDEVDEGEQHLRSSKSPQSGDGQSINSTSKISPLKSQEVQMHRTNSKTPELSEPARKKQKIEEKSPTQTKGTPSETKPTKSQIKTLIVEDKEEEMVDPPPIAPVRMKPVLQRPAPPTAPVRMKPVLQPPTPVIRLPIAVPENLKPIKKTGLNTEAKKPIGDVETKKEENNDPKFLQVDAAPTITKPEVTKKIQSPPQTYLPPIINKPAPTIVAKAAVLTNATQRGSPTFAQEGLSNRSTTGTSVISNYPSTPLLDPVALEAAVKALPEPKESKGEKTGTTKTPRRKPGARECMQISRRFGVNIIPEKYMTILLDYCRRGKVEHLIKMRERLDCHSRFLEYQLAGLEARVKEVGESKVVVPALPPHKRDSFARNRGGGGGDGVTPLPIPMTKKAASGGLTTKVPVADQALGKKPPLVSQASGTSSSKTRTESTEKKLPAKPTTGSKLPISSSISTAAKPALPAPLIHRKLY